MQAEAAVETGRSSRAGRVRAHLYQWAIALVSGAVIAVLTSQCPQTPSLLNGFEYEVSGTTCTVAPPRGAPGELCRVGLKAINTTDTARSLATLGATIVSADGRNFPLLRSYGRAFRLPTLPGELSRGTLVFLTQPNLVLTILVLRDARANATRSVEIGP
jgi:hypothetical protein